LTAAGETKREVGKQGGLVTDRWSFTKHNIVGWIKNGSNAECTKGETSSQKVKKVLPNMTGRLK
jgi:hypothetical protein